MQGKQGAWLRSKLTGALKIEGAWLLVMQVTEMMAPWELACAD